ncbi:MAG TPA: IucA/IucC family protein [Nannocystaceae bacterium]|nr:IucA/IucC family protein [Nannocystaceae bacterium]
MSAFERTIARLSDRFALPRIDPAAPWLRARRIIAARLVLALARERLIDAQLEGGALAIANGPALPLRRVRALELHAPELDGDRDPLLDDPLRSWTALAARLALSDDVVRRIAIELADGVPRLALALWIVELRAREPASLLRLRAAPPQRDGEDLVAIGHPWHPMTKMRLGLSWTENLRYAPELLARAPIAALDVPRALARISGDAIARLAPTFGTATGDRVRVPVHAAQLRRLSTRLPADVWRALAIVPGPPVHARALLSLRTAAIADEPLHVKLALDVHTTSARRIVSPMSVANGPKISALLAAIARADPLTAQGIDVMSEPGAIGLEPAVVGDVAGQLGAIVRDASMCDDAIVCAALGEIDHDGAPVIDRLLARYGGDGLAMLRDYVGVLVPPSLRLWTAHGLALELHLQNVLVRVADGRPLGFLVRDLGGIRIHGPRLARAGHALALDPASFIATDDESAGASKLAHSLVHAHLAAVIGVLADRCGLDESAAWAIVRDAIAACLQTWSIVPALGDACAFDRAHLLAARVQAKALLRMRIEDRSSAYRFVELANPIAAHGAGAPGSDKQ